MSFVRERWEKNVPEVHAALRGGLPAFVFSRRPAEPAGGVPVFCYHAVAHATLEADLRFLRDNGYRTLGTDDLLGYLGGQRPVPERSVVLSFDDGGEGLYRVVYPLLHSFSFRAVAFVAPRFHSARCLAIGAAPRPCTWDELREMQGSGVIEAQSHTLEHRSLRHWPRPLALSGIAGDYLRCVGPPTSVREDLRMSREILENELGTPVRHLAFPRFDGTPEAVRLGRELGYRGFWWGVQPGRPLNRPGDDGTRIVRLSGEFVRRLPGRGRTPLGRILRTRYGSALRSWLR